MKKGIVIFFGFIFLLITIISISAPTYKNNNNYKKINVLIEDIDNGTNLLSILKERLGFTNIKKLEKGVLWTMYFDKKVQTKKIALEITKSLLMNENYQKYKILE